MKRSRPEQAAKRFGAIAGMHLANLIAKTPEGEREALVKLAVASLEATTYERAKVLEGKRRRHPTRNVHEPDPVRSPPRVPARDPEPEAAKKTTTKKAVRK